MQKDSILEDIIVEGMVTELTEAREEIDNILKEFSNESVSPVALEGVEEQLLGLRGKIRKALCKSNNSSFIPVSPKFNRFISG